VLAGRDGLILPAKYLEKQECKSKEQNSGNIGQKNVIKFSI